MSTWTSLHEQARESIDLLAFAASFLHDAVPDFDSELERKARQGVQIRLLFGDPTSEAVRVRGDDEGIGDLLAARCRLTWSYLKPLLDARGILARMHGCTLYNSIFRFDDTLLANTHTLRGRHEPVAARPRATRRRPPAVHELYARLRAHLERATSLTTACALVTSKRATHRLHR